MSGRRGHECMKVSPWPPLAACRHGHPKGDEHLWLPFDTSGLHVAHPDATNFKLQKWFALQLEIWNPEAACSNNLAARLLHLWGFFFLNSTPANADNLLLLSDYLQFGDLWGLLVLGWLIYGIFGFLLKPLTSILLAWSRQISSCKKGSLCNLKFRFHGLYFCVMVTPKAMKVSARPLHFGASFRHGTLLGSNLSAVDLSWTSLCPLLAVLLGNGPIWNHSWRKEESLSGIILTPKLTKVIRSRYK